MLPLCSPWHYSIGGYGGAGQCLVGIKSGALSWNSFEQPYGQGVTDNYLPLGISCKGLGSNTERQVNGSLYIKQITEHREACEEQAPLH